MINIIIAFFFGSKGGWNQHQSRRDDEGEEEHEGVRSLFEGDQKLQRSIIVLYFFSKERR